MRLLNIITTAAITASLFFSSCGKDNTDSNADGNGEKTEHFDWNSQATICTNSLISFFWSSSLSYFLPDNGGSSKFQYWPQAHALDIIIDAFIRTGDENYKNLMDNWFTGVKAGNGNKWKNAFYDDMEWIALACERAYRATGDDKWDTVVKTLWNEIKSAWNEEYADGGMAWKTDQPYSKNACSNGPAAILAARLAKSSGIPEHQEFAVKIFRWEKDHLLKDGLILDHIDGRTDQITTWKFTYNQGTYIGAAIELYNLTGDKSYLDDARIVADKTISSLTTNSVLKLEGSPDSSEDSDAHLFKGIFIRYLNLLIGSDISEIAKKSYISFIEHNAQTLVNKGMDSHNNLFGPDWNTRPGSVTTLKSEVSGCTLIEAAAHLYNKNLI